MAKTSEFLLTCLFTFLPGPLRIKFEDANLQSLPVDRTKCPEVNLQLDIRFILYTRHNLLFPQTLGIGDDEALSKSYMDFSKPTIMFFHGFFEDSNSTSASAVRTAYTQGDYNVILVDAERLEPGPWYLTSARNTRVIGQYSAIFIDYLVSRGLQMNTLHLVGFSLGAQIAAVVGHNVRSGRIQRITGLDPARPAFVNIPLSLRLDKSDAEFVDIIHTDAGVFGYNLPVGHVDFWPNGGVNPQPGCKLESVKKRNPGSIMEPLFCSHWRAYQYFAESLLNEGAFIAVKCSSWKDYKDGKCADSERTNMGFKVSKHARGNFYLSTNPSPPFSETKYIDSAYYNHL